VIAGILYVANFEAAIVFFTVGNNADTAHIAASSDVDDVARVKLDKLCNFARGNVNLDRVIDLDERVWVANGATVMGDQKGDSFSAKTDHFDLAEFELGLVLGNAVNGEASLDIVDETEVLSSLFN
jgi:hypothetical protein